jgi:hypothetical protein
MDAASPGKNGCLKWVIKLGHCLLIVRITAASGPQHVVSAGLRCADFVVKVADEDGEDRQRELCTLPTALCRGLLRLTLP